MNRSGRGKFAREEGPSSVVMGRLGDQRVCKLGGDLAANAEGKSLSLAAAGLPCNSHSAPQGPWDIGHGCIGCVGAQVRGCVARVRVCVYGKWPVPHTLQGQTAALPTLQNFTAALTATVEKGGSCFDRIRVERQEKPAGVGCPISNCNSQLSCIIYYPTAYLHISYLPPTSHSKVPFYFN